MELSVLQSPDGTLVKQIPLGTSTQQYPNLNSVLESQSLVVLNWNSTTTRVLANPSTTGTFIDVPFRFNVYAVSVSS